MMGTILGVWDSSWRWGNENGRPQTCISACSWPFFGIANVWLDDVKMGVHVEAAWDVAGSCSSSLLKWGIGNGRGRQRTMRMTNNAAECSSDTLRSFLKGGGLALW
jgi:hypothetical protein